MKKVVALVALLAVVGASVAGCNWKFWGSAEDAKTEQAKDAKKK